MLDLGGAGGELLAQGDDDGILGRQCRIALSDHGLEGSSNIVGEVGMRGHAGSLRRDRDVYKPEAGRCVRCGRRQSIPSSIDSCAWVSDTDGDLAIVPALRPWG